MRAPSIAPRDCAPRPQLDRVDLIDRESRSTATQWKLNLPMKRRKKRWRRDEVVRRQLGNGDKNKIRGIYCPWPVEP